MSCNVIFLDIDGVLNSNNLYTKKHYENKLVHFDDTNFDWFLYSIEFIKNLKIVISSSWRVGCDEPSDFFKRADELGASRLRELEQYLHQDWKTVKRLTLQRGEEVKDWLLRHKSEVDNYLILDDDSDFYSSQQLLRVDPNTGLGALEAEVIRMHFNANDPLTLMKKQQAVKAISGWIRQKIRSARSVEKILNNAVDNELFL